MKTTIVEQLSELTKGLYYLGESEYLFDVLMWNDIKTNRELHEKIAARNETGNIETIDATLFFDHLINHQDMNDPFVNSQSLRYEELYGFLCEHLSALTVIKSGLIEKDIFIAGFTPNLNCIALHTVAIET